MAVPHLQLERLLPFGESLLVIDPLETLVFDTIVAEQGLGAQFDYDDETGVITFMQSGYYYIDWFVAPEFGLTTDGSNWAIQTSLSGMRFIGSSHTMVAITTGFAILIAEEGETAELVNVSDGPIQLSKFVQSKAGLILFSAGVINLTS